MWWSFKSLLVVARPLWSAASFAPKGHVTWLNMWFLNVTCCCAGAIYINLGWKLPCVCCPSMPEGGRERTTFSNRSCGLVCRLVQVAKVVGLPETVEDKNTANLLGLAGVLVEVVALAISFFPGTIILIRAACLAALHLVEDQELHTQGRDRDWHEEDQGSVARHETYLASSRAPNSPCSRHECFRPMVRTSWWKPLVQRPCMHDLHAWLACWCVYKVVLLMLRGPPDEGQNPEFLVKPIALETYTRAFT